MDYYIAKDSTQHGPFPRERLLAEGLEPTMLVWREGMAQWTAAAELPELGDLFAPVAAVAVTALDVPEAPAVSPVGVVAQPVYAGQLEYNTPPNMSPQSSLAIASMVTGIVSLPMTFCMWYISLPLAIAAVVMGFIAKARANRGETGGKGMAVAGIICGFCTIGISLLLIALMIAFFGVVMLSK